jgi:ribokinase
MEDGRGDNRPPGRVIVVGSINVDLVLRVPRLPGPGETVTGGTFARHHGGKGANQAVAAARAGAAVFAVGAVGGGGDRDGQDSLVALAAAGVNVSAVARIRGERTGHAAVVVDASGDNQIAVAPGANAALTADHVQRFLGALAITGADVIVLSFELADAPLLAAAAAARRAGAVLVVNPAPARECDPGLLRGVVLTPNRQELLTLAAAAGAIAGAAAGAAAEADLAAAASALSARTGGPVIATLGERGALLADGTRTESFPGYRVAARDTTGAGDTLTGVLAAGLAEGSDTGSALRRAVAAAALAVTHVGARAGMPAAAEIDALLAGESPRAVPPQAPAG